MKNAVGFVVGSLVLAGIIALGVYGGVRLSAAQSS